jgi:cell division control protein 6
MIRTSPKQLQAALYAALTGKSKVGALHTGDAHLVYTRFCNEVGLEPISQRAFSDLLYELDMYGYIRARTVSRGRYGRTKEVYVSLEPAVRETLVRQIRKNFDLCGEGVSV